MGGFYYTTQSGDMWDFIAWKVYGTEMMIGTLMEAKENIDILETYIFESGVKVWCPYVNSEEIEDESPDWRDNE